MFLFDYKPPKFLHTQEGGFFVLICLKFENDVYVMSTPFLNHLK